MGIDLLLAIVVPSVGATWAILDRIHSIEKHIDKRLDVIEQKMVKADGDRHSQEIRIQTLEDYNRRELDELKQAITLLRSEPLGNT